MIDNECELDGEGTGIGSGEDAGHVGYVDNEYTEFKIVDECNKEVDREINSMEKLFNAEDLIEQLHVCNSVL